MSSRKAFVLVLLYAVTLHYAAVFIKLAAGGALLDKGLLFGVLGFGAAAVGRQINRS